MTPRRRLLVAATLGLSVLVVAVAAGAGERGDGEQWAAIVDDARTQMRDQDFAGVVVVEWEDGDGPHRVQLTVRQHDGVVEVEGDDRMVAGDTQRVMLDGQAWTTLGRAHATGVPGLTRGKYEIAVDRGPTIAGYPTTRYEARRGGEAVERVYVRDDTRMVLRREVLGTGGDTVRSVSFVRVDEAATTGRPTPTSIAMSPTTPRAVDDLDRPYRDPASAGDGYRLVGRWRHHDGVAQLYYTDGVLSVSVFEQPGRLEWDDLPDGGTETEVNGGRARRYALPVGEAWVFERAGVVYTCVGDAPAAEIAALASEVSQPAESRAERLARTIVEPFQW